MEAKTIETLTFVRGTLLDFHAKHTEFWNAVTFNPGGFGFSPEAIGYLSITEGPAAESLRGAIRGVENELVEAGVSIERTRFERVGAVPARLERGDGE